MRTDLTREDSEQTKKICAQPHLSLLMSHFVGWTLNSFRASHDFIECLKRKRGPHPTGAPRGLPPSDRSSQLLAAELSKSANRGAAVSRE
jgi:hypothetical protein